MMNFFESHKKISLVILLSSIFLVSFALHYFIYWSKGFVQSEYYNLLMARNLAKTGQMALENKDNVILSTQTLLSQGVSMTNMGNKLTYLLYSVLFKFLGFHPLLPLYTTFILYSLSAVFLFLFVWRLFGFRVGLIAAFLSVAAPFSLAPSNTIGHHEWA